MLEAAEIEQTTTKAEYVEALEKLRIDLLNAQFDLANADFSVVILLGGDDRPACGAALKAMHEWMDQRHLETHALGPPTEEERELPPFWRFWHRLPRKGRIGVFVNGWVQSLIRDALDGDLDDDGIARRNANIQQFEEDLAHDGTLILKYWFHLSKKGLQKRLKKAKKHPEKIWWVDEQDRLIYERYDEALPIAERVLRKTSSGAAQWNIIPSENPYYCHLTFARSLHDRLIHRLAEAPAPAAPLLPAIVSTGTERRTVLDEVDLSKSLAKEDYDKQRKRLQADLSRLSREAFEQRVSSVLVFEGWDAAGKGGVIRRLTWPIDARLFQVVPVAAPTEEEKAHHYLWRFWRQLPSAGHHTIFDRSWYGRVLVERVEGFAREDEWRRAYREINDFEVQLASSGMVVLKFWLHIDPEEQRRRFQVREKTAFKKYKITDEDYRNRDKWDAYVAAIDEMVTRTSTDYAPWHVVPANDKRHARIKVLKTYVKALKKRL
ncbi:MAG: polyphosphate:AMP phosphotransferase [Myxococcota bacterium]